MCTIGVVFNEDRIYTFKQCDLVPLVTFNEPATRLGAAGRYIALTRGQDGRLWSGLNEFGVGFVAADSYTADAGFEITGEDVEALFAAYETSLSAFTTAPAAAAYLASFYLGQLADSPHPYPAPDIALHTGWADAAQTEPIAILTEYRPGFDNPNPVRQIQLEAGFYVSTNHFRLHPEDSLDPDNHSSYLRLARAEIILAEQPDYDGIRALLCDQYFGPTELSICRETAAPEEEFQTQATALFTVAPEGTLCEYQINGNPLEQPLQTYEPD